jgi:hypothetical protein
MKLEQLQAMVPGPAPQPVAFGALQDISGAPAPSPEMVAMASGGDAPGPMSMEELEAVAKQVGSGASRKN